MSYPSIWPELEESWVRDVPEDVQRAAMSVDQHVRVVRNMKTNGYTAIRRAEYLRNLAGEIVPQCTLNGRRLTRWFPLFHFKSCPLPEEVKLELWMRDSWRHGGDKKSSIKKAHKRIADDPYQAEQEEIERDYSEHEEEGLKYLDDSLRGKVTVSGSGKGAAVSDLRRLEA